jgi:hypothetical protein
MKKQSRGLLFVMAGCSTLGGMGSMRQDIPLPEIVVHELSSPGQQHVFQNSSELMRVSELGRPPVLSITQEYYVCEPLLQNCGLSGYIVGNNPIKKMGSLFLGSLVVILCITYGVSRF